MKRILLSFFIITFSLQAQVGIGTNTPKSKLEVNGDIKIGNEGKTDDQGEAGMLRWNGARACLESHDGKIWQCANPTNSFKSHQTQILRVSGGKKLIYDDGRGWANNSERGHLSDVLILANASGTKKEIYDPYTGTITIDEEGLYRISYSAEMQNHPPGGAFDGESGHFSSWLTLNYNTDLSAKVYTTVFRGRKVNIGLAYYQNNDSTVAYLKKGDKVHLRFTTYGTPNMNTNTKDAIYIQRDKCWIELWKL